MNGEQTVECKGWLFTSVNTACSNCKYWNLNTAVMMEPMRIPKTMKDDETDTIEVGRCQRHAPSDKGWPLTRKDDWCGDFYFNEPIPKT